VQGAIARGMMAEARTAGFARVPSTELPNLSTISAPGSRRSRPEVPGRYETEWPSVFVRPMTSHSDRPSTNRFTSNESESLQTSGLESMNAKR